MIRSLIVLGVLSVSVLLLAACGEDREKTEPDKLVPAGSNLVAELQVAKILGDSDLESLFESFFESLPSVGEIPGSLEEALDRVIEETGVDPRQFSTLVAFARLTDFDDEAEGAVILRGSFDEEALVKAIKKASGERLEATEYKDHRILMDEDEDTAFSVVEKGTLVLGSPEGVRSVIDVRVGDAEPFGGPLADTFGELGEPWLKLVLEVPEEVKEELERDSDFGLNLFGDSPLSQVLKDIHTIAIMADRGKDGLVFEAWADFGQKSAAADAAEGLEAVFTLARLGLREELGGLLSEVRVSAAGTKLTARSEVTFEELKSALEGLVDGLAGPFIGGILGGQEKRREATPREVAPAPAVPPREVAPVPALPPREGPPTPAVEAAATRVPVPVPAVPRPGSPRFIVIANYEVPDDPPAELLDAATERFTGFLGAMGLSGGTKFGGGVFAVEILDVFDLEQAMGLLNSLAASFRLELIDVRVERSKAEGQR